jgi:Fe2+ transport system protein FeoA
MNIINKGDNSMTLDMANKGFKIEILSIPDPLIRAQAIRLGIYEGAKLICAEKLPKGPVILQNRMQEIAIGRGLAQQITIKTV